MNFLSVLWAFLGTAGFALTFNLSWADLAIASTGGAIAWGAAKAVETIPGQAYLAYFAGAAAAGIWAETIALIRRRPAAVYAVPGVISLVPGAGMYATLQAVIRGDAAGAAANGVAALQAAGFIAAGIALAAAVFSPLRSGKLERRGGKGSPPPGGRLDKDAAKG
jgi:uncharacterized membrane protein YjjB (DUF3815 family)